MSFPRYPEYKESGVEWLGEVPAHWSVQRLSWMFGLISSGTTPPSENPRYYEGDICWVTTGELREAVITDTEKKVSEDALLELSALRVYPVGTLLIALYGATIGRLGVLGVEACTNQACCALVYPINVYSRFIFYVLSASKEYLLLIASGGGQPNINQDKIRSLRISVPALNEQEIISGFLDNETKKIDSLISEQEKLIALLKEKRQSVISHAVTKGLDPNVPMKDSGIEWLGEVPAHWKIKRVSWVFSMISSGTTPSSDTDKYYGGDISWVTTGELRESVIFETEKTVTNQAVAELSALRIYPVGTLLIALYGATIGRLGFLGVEAATNQACCAMVGPVGVVPQFVFYALMAAKEHLLLIASGGGQPNINQDKVRSLRIPVPELAEQERIVSELEDAVNRIDLLIDQAEHGIRLLSERRSALISAVVTGKIDVRQYKAREVA